MRKLNLCKTEEFAQRCTAVKEEATSKKCGQQALAQVCLISKPCYFSRVRMQVLLPGSAVRKEVSCSMIRFGRIIATDSLTAALVD